MAGRRSCTRKAEKGVEFADTYIGGIAAPRSYAAMEDAASKTAPTSVIGDEANLRRGVEPKSCWRASLFSRNGGPSRGEQGLRPAEAQAVVS
jgi:hypothetical protein